MSFSFLSNIKKDFLTVIRYNPYTVKYRPANEQDEIDLDGETLQTSYINNSSQTEPSFVFSALRLTFLLFISVALAVSFYTFRAMSSSIGNTWSFDQESLTRDVQIKQIHSHNDYWRDQPLFDALSYGVISVEADIWHFPEGLEVTSTETTAAANRTFESDELYVGHSSVYLKPDHTLNKLYLDPIFNLLQTSNPLQQTQNGTNATFAGEPALNGIFYDFPDEPLYLWFDIKTSPNDTYSLVKPLLQRFIDRGFLTHYDTASKKVVNGPLVVTLTGNLPTELVKAETTRYVFLDGPLAKFNSSNDASPGSNLSDLAALSLVASGSLQDILGGAASYQTASKAPFTSDQIASIKDHADTAHKYNLKTRIWGGINWPNFVKLAHYQTYFETGIDLLNVDDLAQAAEEF